MIASVSALIAFDRFMKLDSTHHVRQDMTSNNNKLNDREKKPRVNSQQKKLRRQQIFMSVVGIILVISMVLALVSN